MSEQQTPNPLRSLRRDDVTRMAKAAVEELHALTGNFTPWDQLDETAQDNWRSAMVVAIGELVRPTR